MLISLDWIRSFFTDELPNNEQIVQDLCESGTEAVLIKSDNSLWQENVIVAEITSAKAHPNADRLQVCEVYDGTQSYPIVCGAANARVGIKVALAKVGALLPNGLKIKKSKIRSEISHGMLCSYSELDVAGDDQGGIMELDEKATLGVKLADFLNLSCPVIECELTANRPDCLSALGMAREVSSVYKKPITDTVLSDNQNIKIIPDINTSINVTVDSSESCPYYSATVIESIDNSIKTPDWIASKLKNANITQHNIIIDITNYVMLEIGQPLHAFDKNKINGNKIFIRFASENESCLLLNNKEQTLKTDSLVIADEKEVIALAGIMGSLNSSCDSNTQNIILESAFFMPNAIAGKARQYGLHTDSSHRFERGTDCLAVSAAANRAIYLLKEYTNCKVGNTTTIENTAEMPKTKEISIQLTDINRLLGIKLTEEKVGVIFSSIHCKWTLENHTFCVTPPSYRWDLSIKVDLIEEVGRLYGFNLITAKALQIPVTLEGKSSKEELYNRLVDYLSEKFYEVVNYSFIEEKLTKKFHNQPPVLLQNPISKNQAAMRTHIFPSLLKNIKYNLDNGENEELRFFETAMTYRGELNSLKQNTMLAGVVFAGKQGSWQNNNTCDFYWLKEYIANLLSIACISKVSWLQENGNSYYHPAQCARIECRKQVIGYVGFIHPSILAEFGIKNPVLAFELDFDLISSFNNKSYKYKDIIKNPAISRDFSFIVPSGVSFSFIENCIKRNAGDYLDGVKLFDLYSGKNLPEGSISLAVRCLWRHKDKTLADDEIDNISSNIINALSEQNIKLRDL